MSEPVPSEAATQSQGAVIIPFPVREMVQEAASGADADAEEERVTLRLERALASLVKATENQRAAVAKWRENLATLQATMAGLNGSLQVYRTALSGTGEKINDLVDQARAQGALPQAKM